MASAGTSVGGVTVLPESFTLVDYDAGAIAEVAAQLWEKIGLPAELPLRIEVDETTPLGRAYVLAVEPAVELAVESGAFEHLHQPRQFDPDRASDVLGRIFFRLRDRLDPAFGTPPADEDLTLELSTAWDCYAVGRMARSGYNVQRQRRLYQFRLRHGFTDVADAAFTQLWEGENLRWEDLEKLSAGALG
jgi:hypothetical protein